MFTVGQVAALSGVTIKALHHYHKIGLVVPSATSDAGYRLYSRDDLLRLQQVAFYRELDFALPDIRNALSGETSRVRSLELQRELLVRKQRRLGAILATLDNALDEAKGGSTMTDEQIFKGMTKDEWNEVLHRQNEHLRSTYGFDATIESDVQVEKLNAAALESKRFSDRMVGFLTSGRAHTDAEVLSEVGRHVQALNEQRPTDGESYFRTVEFLVQDTYHREMFEQTQTGFSSYLFATAYAYRHQAV